MSDKNPCPFCGDYSEYLRFLDLCAERANEIWRENEVKILTDVCKAMESAQVVHCRDCKHWATEARFTGKCVGKRFNPDGFCSWGVNRENVQ